MDGLRSKPLVSIIIPAYNAAEYLARAIDSALSQTYNNIEIIVVNDGSADNGETERLALSYGDKIRYFYKENAGCASALNFGIDVMKGDWFSWLSHDDLYMPEKVESLINALEENKLDSDRTVLACDSVLINEKGNEVPCPFKQTRGLLTPQQSFAETLLIKTFNGCGLLISKRVIERNGYFLPEYKHLLDREYWMRLALDECSYFVVREPLVKNRVHGKQITVQQSAVLYDEESRLIEEYISKIGKDKSKDCFLFSLCCFAYKRNHYDHGKRIYKRLKSDGFIGFPERARLVKYIFIGKTKNTLGRLYKKIIRR